MSLRFPGASRVRRELLERAFQGWMLLCEEPREEVDSDGSDDSEGREKINMSSWDAMQRCRYTYGYIRYMCVGCMACQNQSKNA